MKLNYTQAYVGALIIPLLLLASTVYYFFLWMQTYGYGLSKWTDLYGLCAMYGYFILTPLMYLAFQKIGKGQHHLHNNKFWKLTIIIVVPYLLIVSLASGLG